MKEEIIAFRHKLHQNPDLSNDEYKTTKLIADFMRRFDPDDMLAIGNTGLAFVFQGYEIGPTIVFRAELDGFPIQEQSNLPYSSATNGKSHVCGHDGHMAILVALAEKIASNRPTKGRVVLLFQPAEETGHGAKEVLNSPIFKELNPDYIFALHNIPGLPKHQILLRNGSFASASKGLCVKLKGKTAHAAEPENGINPADALAKIVQELHELRKQKEIYQDFIQLTIIHMLLGEIAFGTSPGYAELRITLRAFEAEDMNLLTEKVEKIISKIAQKENLSFEFEYCEDFPATVNNEEAVKLVEEAAKSLKSSYSFIPKPFKWSEDFAFFAQEYKSCYFGLGSGKDQPPLHNPNFDFPDDIIDTGASMFEALYHKLILNA